MYLEENNCLIMQHMKELNRVCQHSLMLQWDNNGTGDLCPARQVQDH